MCNYGSSSVKLDLHVVVGFSVDVIAPMICSDAPSVQSVLKMWLLRV